MKSNLVWNPLELNKNKLFYKNYNNVIKRNSFQMILKQINNQIQIKYNFQKNKLKKKIKLLII